MKTQIHHLNDFLYTYNNACYKNSNHDTTKFLNNFTSEFVKTCKNLFLNLQAISFFHDQQKVHQIIFHSLEKISELIYLKEFFPQRLKKYINFKDTDYIVLFDHILYIIGVEQQSIFVDNRKPLINSNFISSNTSPMYNIIPKFIFLTRKVIKVNLAFIFYQHLSSKKVIMKDQLPAPEKIHQNIASQNKINWNCFWELNSEFKNKPFFSNKTNHEFCGVSFLSN